MQINIQAQDLALTEDLREHVERRLRFALGWADDHLRQISVRLSAETNPHGGKENRCWLRIGVSGAPSMVIEDIEDDVHVAIDRAVDRAGRAVARRLERMRDHRQGPSPPIKPDNATTPSLH